MLSKLVQPCTARTALCHVSAAVRCISGVSSRNPADEAPFPTFTGETKLFINNEFIDSKSGKKFPTYNPGNGEVIAEVSEAQPEDVDIAVRAARRAFDEGPWYRSMSPRDRQMCMYRLVSLLEEHHEELATIEALNNGKTLAQARMVDANACAGQLRYFAGWADKISGRTIPIDGGFDSSHFMYTRHEPVGVCGQIIPWNLPLIGVAAKIGPALACGNTVVLKPAEQTPLSALKVAELVQKSGFPDGVINIVTGDGPTTGASIVNHPDVDKISFTGSVEVGKVIQRDAAATLKKVTLELGGSNPFIVFADADIDAAVETAHNALLWNEGEACAAGTRFFVEDVIYDEFVEKSVELVAKRRVGNPFHSDTQHGALVSEEQMDKVLGFVKAGEAEGAKLLIGGHRVGTRGNYVAPAVFSECTDDMKVFKEEVFGPVMTLAKFSLEDGLESLARRANDSPFGLAAGVFTKDLAKAHFMTSRIRAGLLFQNCYHVMDISAPFGGMKQSGSGREGGEYGLLPYLEIKNVAQRVIPY